MLEDLELNKIQNIEQARECIVMLLNLVEVLKSENKELREQVQRLRDEINRLKGEQGKPEIKPNKRQRASSNHSSERERHKPKERKKSRKLDQIEIDRVETLNVEPERLPEDVQFKGYKDVVVQDIEIRTDNVLFRKKKVLFPLRRQDLSGGIAPVVTRGNSGQASSRRRS